MEHRSLANFYVFKQTIGESSAPSIEAERRVVSAVEMLFQASSAPIVFKIVSLWVFMIYQGVYLVSPRFLSETSVVGSFDFPPCLACLRLVMLGLYVDPINAFFLFPGLSRADEACIWGRAQQGQGTPRSEPRGSRRC